MLFKFYLALATMFFISADVRAFDATSKTVNVVIPFTPGGGVDQTFRHFEKWAMKKNITFITFYKPGAEGLIGMNEIAVMPKDGYHIAFVTAGTIAVQRIKNPQADLETVTMIKNSISAFITHKNSGIHTVDDLYKGSDPKTLAYGAPGQMMAMQQMIARANGKLKDAILVPYRGGAGVVQDIAGNHVQFAAPPLLISKSLIDSGTIRLLAVGSRTRLKEYPNVPTITEFFPGWQDQDGFAVVLPKDTDTTAVQFWNNLLREYLSDKTVQGDFVKEFNESNKFGKEELEKLVSNSMRALQNSNLSK